jgi:hypothetical protein
MLGWAMNLVTLGVAIAIVAQFFRDNALAYVGAAFCALVANPLIDLLSQPPAFYRWNGLLLGLLTLAVLGWMLLTGRESPPSA